MGLVSRTGLVPCGLTQDTIGPITRTVADAAVLLDIIAGHDPADPATSDAAAHIPRSYTEGLDPDGLNGARIGVLRAFFGDGAEHRAVNAVMQRALSTIQAQGAELVEIDEAIHPDALLADTLVHLYEMKGDLDAYLADAPSGVSVRSMEDIITSASVHPSVAATLKSAMTLAGDETEYRERLQRQQALRDRILGLMAAHRLDALAFPHQRRLAVPVGQAQAERNGVLRLRRASRQSSSRQASPSRMPTPRTASRSAWSSSADRFRKPCFCGSRMRRSMPWAHAERL